MLGFALDLISALAADQDHSLTKRHTRDRELALKEGLAPLPAQPSARLAALECWWRLGGEALRTTTEARSAGAALDRARALGGLALTLLGFVLGSSVTAVALRYDGSAPINLISLLGVLVVLPGLMLLFTLLLLPGRAPGLGWLQDVLATFSPGQWLSAAINRRFPQADLGWFEPLAPPRNGFETRLGERSAIGRWQLVCYGQLFAVAFFLASLAVLLLRVTFSDLTFGWSTTLELNAQPVVRWVAALSTPFAALWPAAAPEPELVRLSQFNRAAPLDPVQVQRLGAWWPFLVCTIACYGLLPRLLLLWLAQARLKAAERRALLQHPLVQRLFERMDTPVVDHRVDRQEEFVPSTPAPAVPDTGSIARLQIDGARAALVNWNGAVPEAELGAWLGTHLSSPPASEVTLGTQTPLADEQRALAGLSVDTLLVLCKAWEPPLLEFLDFAARAKAALGAEGRVLIVPVGIEAQPPSPADLGIWQDTVRQLDDIRVRVFSWNRASESAGG